MDALTVGTRADDYNIVSVNDVTTEQAKHVFDLLPVSEITKDNYKRCIGDFVEFVHANGLNINTLVDYRKHLDARTDYSISTKNKYFTTAKRYAGILFNAGMIPKDITKDISGATIKGFKQSAKHKKDGVQANEIARIANYLDNLGDYRKAVRLKAMFALLIYQGLRQIEVARLDVTDLDLNRGKALILGKGRDDKEPIALHPYTVKALEEYLAVYHKKSGALFTSESHRDHGNRLTTRSIRRIVEQVLSELNIHNSTHGFRHYFVTNMIKNYNGDLLAVMHYSRHKSIGMLEVYNDALNAEQDLPRYIHAFEGVRL